MTIDTKDQICKKKGIESYFKMTLKRMESSKEDSGQSLAYSEFFPFLKIWLRNLCYKVIKEK